MGAAIALFLGTGCTATTTVGSRPDSPLVDASVGKDGVSVAIPFLKAGVAPIKKD